MLIKENEFEMIRLYNFVKNRNHKNNFNFDDFFEKLETKREKSRKKRGKDRNEVKSSVY